MSLFSQCPLQMPGKDGGPAGIPRRSLNPAWICWNLLRCAAGGLAPEKAALQKLIKSGFLEMCSGWEQDEQRHWGSAKVATILAEDVESVP